jgi:hypothetical protein
MGYPQLIGYSLSHGVLSRRHFPHTRHTQQLRVITVDSLLSIAELIQDDRIAPDEAVVLLKPTSPVVDDTGFCRKVQF